MHDDVLLSARALVLADLEARGLANPWSVSLLESALADRTWWVEQWPEGSTYVAGLVAQDVQDALFESVGRWPLCRGCPAEEPEHALHVHPELGGPEPGWFCEEAGVRVADLGGLPRA